ncbi:lysosome membrane protein 2-like [Actinia tenebrosa]|uniref:Lysosome membrane protein 2-like n=1 Tax=Actinia tenebrosa TaxID=6105 RepID=A0A6P8HPG7_ACTTE|nr:lysosome membrane protein 2-like [Actinia tenebrosa]
MTCKCSLLCLSIALAFIGAAFLVTGLVLWLDGIFQNIINKKVDESIMLKEGGLVFKQWQEPTSPILMQYFFFDLKNPQEVFEGKGKPFLSQKGPYSYREMRSNHIRNWTNGNTEVIFMPNRTYIFDPETSCEGCNDTLDTFTTVNIPLLALAKWLKDTNYSNVHPICLTLLKGIIGGLKVKLFQNKTVHKMLWGYEDEMLKLLKAFSNPLCPVKPGIDPFIQLQYNNTYFGISAINTGQKDIDKLEQYTMWRDANKLSWWMDNYTNMINGTDGTQFKPRISKDDKLYAFVPEICRSIYAVYDSTIKVRDITLYRFTSPKELYLSGDVYPLNKGFCVPPACLPTGLLNVTLCQPQNPPIAISPPHFYEGNVSLVEAVDGLDPKASEHATYIDIEPITGITMQANKRIQVNAHVMPFSKLPETDSKMAPVFLPIMYVNESAKISEHDAADFRKQVYDKIELTKGIEFGCIALGAVLIAASVIVFIFHARRKGWIFNNNKDEKLLNEPPRTYGNIET